MKQRVTAIVLVLFLIIMTIPTEVFAAETNELETMINATSTAMKGLSGAEEKKVLSDITNFPAGNSLCDWAAITWAFSGEDEDYETYLSRLEKYVTECYAKYGCIDGTKATETQRIALTVLALGGDPLQFGTNPEGESINLIADGTYAFRLGDSLDADTGATESYNEDDGTGLDLGKQGLNGYVYALLLLDAKNYEIPAGEYVTREVILNAILSAQLEDGAFSLGAGGKGNIDITAMTLQALAPYQDQDKVKQAIDKAITWLGEQMTPYATFNYYGEDTSESSSQVILAMSALGIDITKEERLTKNGMTLLDGLELFRLDDGGYMHTMSDGNGNLMATQQALLALNALKKQSEGNGRLFDLTDYEGPVKEAAKDSMSGALLPGVCAAMALIVVIIVVLVTRRKNEL